MQQKSLAFISVLLLLGSVLFAGGAQESENETGAETAVEGAATGGIKVWDTLQDFEAEGGVIEGISQSPFLDDRDLPPVAERVGEEPMVIRPYEEIGTYGGTARVWTKRPSPTEDGVGFISHESALKLSHDDATFVPNVVKAYEWSNGGRTITLTLRQGMKWSDGDAFDTEDIRFWWEDIIMNDELTPAKPAWLKTSGGIGSVSIEDEVTFRFDFKEPYPIFINRLGHYQGTTMFLPSHYLKQFHIEYNDEATELAKEEGYETWVQLFADKQTVYQGSIRTNHEPNVPTLYDYVMVEQGTDYWIFERNPYYWKVDSAGQQLPYIDRVYVQLASNVEMVNAKIIGGETDFAVFNNSLDNYTLYKENEEAGGYRTLLWSRPVGAYPVLMVNQTYAEDTELRDIFRDVRFRRALSLAVNRDEINEALFFERAVPRQQTVAPSSRFFRDEFAEAYAGFDLERANELLDEMGLEWDSNEQWRLRPNGEPLIIVLEYGEIGGAAVQSVIEMVQQHWAQIGVDLRLKLQSGELLAERVPANLTQAGLWVGEHITDVLFPINPIWFVPFSNGWENSWSPLWAQWISTDGAEGVEPPPELMRQYELWQSMLSTVDNAEQVRLGQSILESQAENLWTIGTIGLPPQPVIARTNLRNIPEEGISAWDNFWGQSYYPEQRFFKRPLLPAQR